MHRLAKLVNVLTLLAAMTLAQGPEYTDVGECAIMEERKDLMCNARKYGLERMENRRL